MKKFVSLILVVCILSGSCLAAGSINADSNVELVNAIGLTEAQMADISASLQAIEPSKADLGLANVDLTTLSIGEEIFAYEYTAEGLTQLDFSMYPLITPDGDIVAFAMKDGVGPDAITKQISTTLAVEVNEVAKITDQIALIYSAEGCSVYDGRSFYGVYSDCIIDERASIPAKTTANLCEQVSFSLCTPQYGVNMLETATSSCGLQDEYSTIVLRSTFVPQDSEDEDLLCWAATMAMVLTYLNGGTYTTAGVATTCIGYFNNIGKSLSQTLSYYAEKYNHLFYYGYDFSKAEIHDVLESGYPIHAEFESESEEDLHHAVMIYGLSSNADNVWIRDPSYGTEVGFYDNVEPNQAYYRPRYISSANGTRFYLYDALYYND